MSASGFSFRSLRFVERLVRRVGAFIGSEGLHFFDEGELISSGRRNGVVWGGYSDLEFFRGERLLLSMERILLFSEVLMELRILTTLTWEGEP